MTTTGQEYIGFTHNKVAIIFGVTGQDGSYLSEYLLDLGYTVIGATRRASNTNTERVAHLLMHPHFKLEYGDVTDYSNIDRLIRKYHPQEVYNLAAQSHVGTSFEQPLLTWDVTAKGCMNILEVVRGMGNEAPRFYQASSSEMFGDMFDLDGAGRKYQDEMTRFNPQSPYAIAKHAAHQSVRLYRDSYDLFVCSGILFNHESPRRGENFVTRKITKYVGNLKSVLGHNCNPLDGYPVVASCDDFFTVCSKRIPKLRLGNLQAKRDWGFAGDYVKAMHSMLQQEVPDDYIVGTGKTYSVEDCCRIAFKHIGLRWRDCVIIDKELFRPSEVPYLCAKPTKAELQLQWKPEVDFNTLIAGMVDYDTW